MQIADTSPTYQCLAYPMLFPRGELGWHPKLMKSERFFSLLNFSDNVLDEPDADALEDDTEDGDTSKGKRQLTVTRTQFYRYQLFPRQGMPNVIFHSGKLHHVYARAPIGSD